ncbi:hypothetical protein [Shimia sp. R9_3]|uniref:hypothetical protein n=1 Tax=Shimia sp. R9_3 TaxID=2821113 RepID=UPI001ADAEB4C|nr:hypothetical protein [Shimia sp. R9_3]MBO9400849.1 hypothetical protein [Shimia sp. R9_3]
MANLETQIEQAQQRLRDLQAKVRKQKRKNETRRLIIYGAAALRLLDNLESDKQARFLTRLHSEITRSSDREFLGLKKLPDTSN